MIIIINIELFYIDIIIEFDPKLTCVLVLCSDGSEAVPDFSSSGTQQGTIR